MEFVSLGVIIFWLSAACIFYKNWSRVAGENSKLEMDCWRAQNRFDSVERENVMMTTMLNNANRRIATLESEVRNKDNDLIKIQEYFSAMTNLQDQHAEIIEVLTTRLVKPNTRKPS